MKRSGQGSRCVGVLMLAMGNESAIAFGFTRSAGRTKVPPDTFTSGRILEQMGQ